MILSDFRVIISSEYSLARRGTLRMLVRMVGVGVVSDGMLSAFELVGAACACGCEWWAGRFVSFVWASRSGGLTVGWV